MVPGTGGEKSGQVGGSSLTHGESQVGVCSPCYAGLCRIHGTEEVGKATLRAGTYRSAYGEPDDLAKFACVPRHVVFAYPISFRIRKRELESGCGGSRSATTCHSLSSDVSGVVEMPLLKQADMLVSEGVGEGVRARGEVFSR